MESINGVTCIKGEIHSIITFIRLNTRWNPTLRINYDHSHMQSSEGVIVQTFQNLNEYLEDIYELDDVDCVVYISPFYNIVISNKANGPLTHAALCSLGKFVLYGFLLVSYPRVQDAMFLIARCISHCVFEETDWESDELILMKLLELSTLCYRCKAFCLLPIGSAWDIYSTCISIHNHFRASKILKSEAENALIHLTLTAFSCAVNSISNNSLANQSCHDNEINGQQTQSIEQILLSDNISGVNWESIGQHYTMSNELGITLLLGKIMSILSDMIDLQTNKAETAKFALSLVNVALEAGGISLGKINPLVDILRNDLCRHLLRASQSDNLEIYSLALRVVYNLFMSIKDHMKIQLEVFLTSVHLRLLTGTSNVKPPITSAASIAREELALESLLEFCREPSLIHDLYINYDCDVQCTNLFDAIVHTLCSKSTPSGVITSFNTSYSRPLKPIHGTNSNPSNVNQTDSNQNKELKLNIINRLACDGLLAVLHSVANRCLYGPSQTVSENLQDYLPKSPPSSKGHNSQIVTLYDQNIQNLMTSNGSNLNSVEEQVDRWCDKNSDVESKLDHNVNNDEVSESLSVSQGEDFEIIHNLLNNHNSMHGQDEPQEDKSSKATYKQNLLPSLNNVKGTGSMDTHPSKVNEESNAGLLERVRTAETIRQRKLMKQKIKLTAEKFNAKPLKMDWVQFALEVGLLQSISSMDSDAINTNTPAKDSQIKNDILVKVEPESVAKFLKLTPGLGKTQIGEFISKGPADLYPFHAKVLKEYVNTFDFSGVNSSFDQALRLFLGHFRLPGEAQCIDRLMEAFAGKLFADLGLDRPFATADAAFILSFSTIMLNTDLHNPQIPANKKMTKEQFVKNNRGINDGKDIPKQYLENLYDEIKSKEIQVDIDISDTVYSVDFTDPTAWNKLIRKGAADQAPALFTPTGTARRRNSSYQSLSVENSVNTPQSTADESQVRDVIGMDINKSNSIQLERVYSTASQNLYERDMFLVMAKSTLETMILLWEGTSDDQLLQRLFQGLWEYLRICIQLNLQKILQSFIKMIVLRSRDHMMETRMISSSAFYKGNVLCSRASYKQWVTETGQDLNKLVKFPMNKLTNTSQGKESLASKVDTRKKINWKYANLIKGELMIKLSLHATRICPPSMWGEDAWDSIISLLIWCRSRGVLPFNLAVIGDDFQSLSNPQDLNSKNSVHEPNYMREKTYHLPAISVSLFARQCSLMAYGHIRKVGQSSQISANSQQSVGANGSTSWVSSIGELLWGISTGGAAGIDNFTNDDENLTSRSDDSGIQANSSSLTTWESANTGSSGVLATLGLSSNDLSWLSNGNETVDSKTVARRDLYYNGNASVYIDLNGESLRPDDSILRISLAESQPEELLFSFAIESGDVGMLSTLLSSMLGSLNESLRLLLRSNNSSTIQPVKRSTEPSPADSMIHDLRESVIQQKPSESELESLESIFPDHLLITNHSGFFYNVSELDAILLLEWSCRVVHSSKSALHFFWPKLHAFLKTILEEFIEPCTMKCPFLLERCIVAIMRGTIGLVDSIESRQSSLNSEPNPHKLVHIPRIPSPVPEVTTSNVLVTSSTLKGSVASDSAWMSFRLLRSIPNDIICQTADRLGAGLYELIRVIHANCLLLTLEHWYMILSLLSAATSGIPGRPFVWASLKYLIDHNMINDYNFTPCRHLLLRFLQGVFPGDSSSDQLVGHHRSIAMNQNNWLLPSIIHLMHMTFMALGSYIGPTHHQPRNGSSSALNTYLPDSKVPTAGFHHSSYSNDNAIYRTEFVTFSLPNRFVPRNSRLNSERSVISRQGSFTTLLSPPPSDKQRPMNSESVGKDLSAGFESTVRGAANETKTLPKRTVLEDVSMEYAVANKLTSFRTIAIHFGRMEEIEMLWIETCRILGDLSNVASIIVFDNTLYAVEGIILAGNQAGLPDDLWHRVLQELLTRLPVSLTAASHRFLQFTNQQIMECCLRCCDIIFDVMIHHVKSLRSMSGFHAVWIRFVNVLATNASLVVKGLPMYEEMLEMLGALLRLLRPPPPIPSQNLQEMTSNGTTSSRLNSKDSGSQPINGYAFGFLSWLSGNNATSTPSGPVGASGNQQTTNDNQSKHGESVSTSNTFDDKEGDDGELLLLSWKTITTIYPAFTANLKSKNPTLVFDFLRFVETAEYHSRLQIHRGVEIRNKQDHQKDKDQNLLENVNPTSLRANVDNLDKPIINQLEINNSASPDLSPKRSSKPQIV